MIFGQVLSGDLDGNYFCAWREICTHLIH